MNVRDSEVIAGLLDKSGYKLIEDETKADIEILNTCSVRQHAEEKVWSAVGRSKAKIIGIVGCMANNYREAIFEKAPKVDFVVGTADIAKIPKILKEIEKHKGGMLEKKIYETDADFRKMRYITPDFTWIKSMLLWLSRKAARISVLTALCRTCGESSDRVTMRIS